MISTAARLGLGKFAKRVIFECRRIGAVGSRSTDREFLKLVTKGQYRLHARNRIARRVPWRVRGEHGRSI